MVAVATLVAVAALVAGCSSSTPRAQPTTPPTTGASPANTSAHTAIVPPALVWTPKRLPAGLADYVAGLQGVAASVVVANGTVWLPGGPSEPRGMALPIDVSATDAKN